MKFKIKETYLLLIIVMGLVSLSVYSTYALFTASTTITDVVSFNATLNTDNNLIEYEMITLSPGEVKMVEINVNNTYSTSLYYGTWYQIVSPSDTTDIVVGLTDDNTSSGSGALTKTSSIKLIVGLANNSSKTAIINIGTVGSTTSNLNLPTGRNLIPEGFSTTNADLIIDSFKVNGTEATTFPINTGSYNIDTTCSNANITYNYKTLRYEVSNISKNKNAKCGFSYTTKSNITYLNDYIISLSGTTQGNGSLVNEKFTETLSYSAGYYYEGINPNNYIYFNNELWRIIGVFDSETHGISDTNLVKIIRNDSIGALVWNKTRSSDWANSSLNHILNDYYYTATDGTDSDYCYQTFTIKGFCDYTDIGLKSDYRSMVETVKWSFSGPTLQSSSQGTRTYYIYERSTSASTTNGKIGLMYSSDVGFSNNCTSCYLANSNVCALRNSWLAIIGGFTITNVSDYSTYVYCISNSGNLNNVDANSTSGIRPALYLKSSVKYISGSGSILDPYVIGL